MAQPSARRTSGRQIRRQTARRNMPLIIGLVVVVVVILLAAGLALSRRGGSLGQQFPDIGGGLHLQSPSDPLPIPYNSNPPTSGYHVGSAIAPWGVQSQPIDDKIWVHNMEHGGVVIHYRQDLDQATVDQLKTLTRDLQQRNSCIVLLPRANDKLDVPIAVTSWTYLLKLQSFDANAIRSFFAEHVGHGPEQVCQPGVRS